MHVPARWALGVPLGLFGVLGSMQLEGGHPSTLLQAGPLALVLGTVVLGALVLRGPVPVLAWLRAAWCGAPDDEEARRAHVGDMALLERLALLGGCLGLFVGGTRALCQVGAPERVGPALAFAMVSLAQALLLNVLVLQPWKHHLLAAPAAEEYPTPRAAVARGLFVFGAFATCAAVCLRFGATGQGGGIATVPGLLLTVAAVLPSLLAAPTAIVGGPLSRVRCHWCADTLWSAGTLAVLFGVLHVFSVLDQPHHLGPGVGSAFASFGMPAALAVVVRMRGSLVPAQPGDLEGTGRSPYPAFASLTLLSLAAMVLYVVMLLWRLQPVHA